MPQLLLFLARKPGTSHAAFREHYETRHVPLCMPYMRGLQRYRRHYVEQCSGSPDLDFDVITELTFADRATCDAVAATMAKDGMPPEIVADEEGFMDRARTRYAVIETEETELD